MSNLIRLLFIRLRVVLLALGFVLMYSAYNNFLNPAILAAGVGLGLLDLFGGIYNDYQDYEQDLKNKRRDKWLTNKLLTRRQMKYLAGAILFLALSLLVFTNLPIFVIGLYYSIVMFGYSHPAIPLGRNLMTYVLLASVYLPLPYALHYFLGSELNLSDLFFSLFFFFQTLYLLCQKDSSDDDASNIFVKRSWTTASRLCVLVAAFAVFALFLVSVQSAFLLGVFGANALIKIYLLGKIYRKEITQKHRSKVVMFEFLTPYLYILGASL